MASSYFTISPTGGTDNGYVIVSPTGQNTTQTDRQATVTISNGGTPVNVTIRHYGMPSIAIVNGSEPVSAPATGGTYQFLVKTHYQVQFYNKPDWITIDDGQGNYISSADTIAASVANGKTYNFTIQPNTSNNTRSTSNFGLWHYINGSLSNSYDAVSISQAQGASDYITITPTSALDWDDTNGKAITINANVSYSVSHSNTTDFTLNGGSGFVTIRANANNTGTTKKTTTISVVSTKASFPYTATCVVTQYRQPTITLNGSGTVANTGGTKYVTVVSDYYWWLSPTVSPDTNAYYDYVTMTAKTADMNMVPTTGTTYELSWNANNGVLIRNGQIYVGYLKLDNSTTARSSSNFSFTQDTVVSDTLTITPSRIPETGYASSGGDVYTLSVITNRTWGLNSNPSFCTVSPTTGNGNTTVTVTIPPSTRTGTSYSWLGSIYFITTDGGQMTSQSVPVYQYDSYPQPAWVEVLDGSGNPLVGYEPDSGGGTYYFSVSASTAWTAAVSYTDGSGWITLGSNSTAGTAGYTTGLYFTVASNSSSRRDAHINITAGTATTYFDVYQKMAATPVSPFITLLLPSSPISTNSGESLYNQFRVSASTDWVIDSKPSWVSFRSGFSYPGTAVTGGTTGDTQFWCAISENTGTTTRSGNIVFELTGASPLTTGTSVTQTGKPAPVIPFVINPDFFDDVPAYSTSITYSAEITAAYPWTATTDTYGYFIHNVSTWTGGTGVTTLYFYCENNTNYGDDRSGAIILTDSQGNTATINVNQLSP